jgi:fluoride exporter
MGVWIAVAVGGALGSVARHAVNHIVHTYWLTTRFPIGTAVINVTGCFVIGLLTGLIASNRLVLRFYWREFVFVGVLGGYTTFSTFGLDTHTLLQTDSSHAAVAYVAANMIGGLAAVWFGYALGLKGI